MTLSQHPQMIAELNQWEEEKRNREMLTGEQFAHHIIGHVLIFVVGGGEGGGYSSYHLCLLGQGSKLCPMKSLGCSIFSAICRCLFWL